MLVPAGAALIVLMIVFLLRGAVLTGYARWLVREDPPGAADAIVVLGGHSGFRVMRAIELAREGLAGRIALTTPDPEFPDLEEPAIRRWLDLLAAEGVSADSIDVLRPSESTFDDARLIHSWARAHGFRSLLVVTDPYHTRRAGWVLRRVLVDPEVEIRVVASNQPWFEPTRWWRDERQLLWVFLEYLKLTYYLAAYGPSGPIDTGPAGLHARPGSP